MYTNDTSDTNANKSIISLKRLCEADKTTKGENMSLKNLLNLMEIYDSKCPTYEGTLRANGIIV